MEIQKEIQKELHICMCLVREISKETQNKTKVQKGKQLPAFPRLA